jgi:hypothetical protein
VCVAVWYVAWKLVLCEVKFMQELVGVKPKPPPAPVTEGNGDLWVLSHTRPHVVWFKELYPHSNPPPSPASSD